MRNSHFFASVLGLLMALYSFSASADCRFDLGYSGGSFSMIVSKALMTRGIGSDPLVKGQVVQKTQYSGSAVIEFRDERGELVTTSLISPLGIVSGGGRCPHNNCYYMFYKETYETVVVKPAETAEGSLIGAGISYVFFGGVVKTVVGAVVGGVIGSSRGEERTIATSWYFQYSLEDIDAATRILGIKACYLLTGQTPRP